jgi:hypothetical protein
VRGDGKTVTRDYVESVLGAPNLTSAQEGACRGRLSCGRHRAEKHRVRRGVRLAGVSRGSRAATIALFPIIFIAMLVTAAVAIAALVGRKWKRAAVWFGACVVITTCGVLLLQSWNRVMLRVNQMAPATQAAR